MPDFKIVRKGYDLSEVNSRIETLNKELSEFKDKENYINRAIISAEMAASDVKAKAEAERSEMLKGA
ncbi:MAG: DivIVA domain-containing protein [Clostridiales bacterium]|nr:DivIVA domain-containing protein [Clostridiales bacterium]